jgi:ABC-type nitrate/sulfonate/bicarbonate transport system permease component
VGNQGRRTVATAPATAAGIVAFLAAWWALSVGLGEIRMPSPLSTLKALVLSFHGSDVLRAYGAGSGGYLPHVWYSIRVAAGGTALGIALGVGLAVLMTWSRRVSLFLTPGIEALRTVPPLAAAPFFLMWFGPGWASQLGLIVVFASLRLVIFTLEAIRNVPPIHQYYAMTLGANRRQLLRTVVAPAIVPELIGAVRVAIATAWGLQVVGELLGTTMGIGKLFNVLSMLLATADILALVLWLTAIAIVTDIVITRLARHATRWLPTAS